MAVAEKALMAVTTQSIPSGEIMRVRLCFRCGRRRLEIDDNRFSPKKLDLSLSSFVKPRTGSVVFENTLCGFCAVYLGVKGERVGAITVCKKCLRLVNEDVGLDFSADYLFIPQIVSCYNASVYGSLVVLTVDACKLCPKFGGESVDASRYG